MNWDDIRIVLAVNKSGSLSRAAQQLGVDHTTVGRRVEAIEEQLGVSLFMRGTKGYEPTVEALRLLPEMRRAEDVMLSIEREALKQQESVDGTVKVTSGETFGAYYLAPRLAVLGQKYPGLCIDLDIGGKVLDLTRREADIAVRTFKTAHEQLVMRKVGEVAYGLYCSKQYAKKHKPKANDLARHPMFISTLDPSLIESKWIQQLVPNIRPHLTCPLSAGLAQAAKADLGIAVLPRYLGDAESSLQRIECDDEPRETLWLTVHRDIRNTKRVRVIFDYLVAALESDQTRLCGVTS